ncbi:MAG: zf-TFIIB domain-containing protein [Gemmatimonadetes bacterium]|nr:zf-TFIIB domain-containing protein [Gemmatimonadota bacterium]
MSEKPSRNEEEYFARQEAELLKARREKAERTSIEAEHQSHYMKCPKCGHDLTVEQYHGIEIDRCTNCNGVWFDAGEAEQLAGDGKEGILASVFDAVVRGVRGKKANTAE